MWQFPTKINVGRFFCKVMYSIRLLVVTSSLYFLGVEIIEKVQVEKVLCRNNQVRAVVTNKGEIQCEHFVNCAGQVGRFMV